MSEVPNFGLVRVLTWNYKTRDQPSPLSNLTSFNGISLTFLNLYLSKLYYSMINSEPTLGVIL